MFYVDIDEWYRVDAFVTNTFIARLKEDLNHVVWTGRENFDTLKALVDELDIFDPDDLHKTYKEAKQMFLDAVKI
jgi:hypothetical protein